MRRESPAPSGPPGTHVLPTPVASSNPARAGVLPTLVPPASPAGIRVVSTPVPPGRLFRDLAARLRALYDGVLSEPVPDRLLAVAGSLHDRNDDPSRQEMSDGAATIAGGVGRRR